MTPLARELNAIWSLLPAFRAIAESEHLPTASASIGLSAPALSRTLGQLEDRLGLSLFERHRGRLVLAPAGRQLLDAVQSSMLTMEARLADLRADLSRGELTVSCGGHVAPHITRAALQLREDRPDLPVFIKATMPDRVVADLKASRLDVAFTIQPLDDPALTNEQLGDEPCAVFCGSAHPLYGRMGVSLDEVVEHAFAAPPDDEQGAAVDGWPPSMPRDVAIRVDHLSMAIEMCRSGSVLVLLPVSIGAAQTGLCQVAVHPDAAIPIVAVRRKRPFLREDRIDLLINTVGHMVG